ncbi:MAG: ATP-binding cassette domain-containing protein [Rhodocyclales bacterium GT-UBC]|nr:MAG: ATP-binding cassette domain-containing protein [Rhodocyclales bacterium GT-UBC]
MIKLKKLTFEGFRTYKHTAIVKFSDELVTVIFGDNGSGKTTYLRAINAFLSQDSSYLDAISVQKIECEFIYDEIHQIFDDDGELVHEEVTAENLDGKVIVEKIDGQYNWSQFEASSLVKTKSLSLGVERGVATQQSRIEPDVILNYFLTSRIRDRVQSVPGLRNSSMHELAEDMSRYIRTWQVNSNRSKRSELRFDSAHVNLQNIKLENVEQILLEHYRFAREIATKQIQDALFNTLSFAISNEANNELKVSREDFISTLKSSRLRLVEALSDNSKNDFKNLIISKLKELDSESSYDAIFDKGLLRALLWNMMGELRLEKLLLSSVNLLAEKFNSYLIDEKSLKILDDKVFIEVDGRELPVSDLSSGERHILTFLTLVLFQGRQRNFLVIDEPEISLNIKWQRELMGLLHNLAPNTQIIVASHSPVLAKRNPSYLSELKVIKGEQ